MNEITSVISAFSADQVVRLTGLTMRQLAYWDDLGFFQPQYAAEDRRSPYSRIYSFKDVVGLRTLSVLKNTYRCSLPHLQQVARKLAAYSNGIIPLTHVSSKGRNMAIEGDGHGYEVHQRSEARQDDGEAVL